MTSTPSVRTPPNWQPHSRRVGTAAYEATGGTGDGDGAAPGADGESAGEPAGEGAGTEGEEAVEGEFKEV